MRRTAGLALLALAANAPLGGVPIRIPQDDALDATLLMQEVEGALDANREELRLADSLRRFGDGGATGGTGGGGTDDGLGTPVPSSAAKERRLPFLGELARERGYELPAPFGAGGVLYFLSRDIDITEVRLGRDGAPLEAVPSFVDLGSRADVVNVNAKVDVWILPFLNLYTIVGYIDNQADTKLEVTLPPLAPGGGQRVRSVTVPTALEGSVGGLGLTLAGGYKSFFFAADVNAARADLGFDDDLDAIVTSLRAGYNGKLGDRALRTWLNATYWDTATTVTGNVADPDGGTLSFEVDQGPLHPWTYGAGMQYSFNPSIDLAADLGADLHGGWYVALVPVFRF